MIAMATEQEPKKKEGVFERRCPSCGYYLWSAAGIEGTVKRLVVIEIQARCSNRRCKRRDRHEIEIESTGV